MNQYERRIGQAAIKTFGRIPNIIKAIEELSELQQALCKHIVSENDAPTVANVHEEIADVQIMLGRLMMLFDPTEVEDWKGSKLDNMAKLLGIEDEEEEIPTEPDVSPYNQLWLEKTIKQDVLADKMLNALKSLTKDLNEAVEAMSRPPEGERKADLIRHGCAAPPSPKGEGLEESEGPEEPTGDALEEMRL